MMKIRIVWPGRTRERYLTEGIDHYLKLLGRFARVSVVEVREERGKSREDALAAEGSRIIRQTQSFVLLDEKGDELTSPGFASLLGERPAVDFVLGGPFGVSREVRDRADTILALSRMTLTHEMARLVLLEQLYRAFTIQKGMEYHH
ncbi:MAG TPA: 23S rRNA (pseudouridine(1915)-N(3))-methyltransferase RlmH [Dissulfurispiraceae bacterium]|nr:23S rRNA (pseudouridine(1915)-N(3))-methyltransferase RlmH [Dissulfurispiraceae bacterium]